MALFCCLDDFAMLFEEWERHHLIPSSCQRRCHGKLSLGEMLFIMVLFHISPYKDFKHFWHYGRNRVFQGMAKRGRNAMGWFFGFKLHLLINHKGQLMAFKITAGSADDRKPLQALTAAVQGKVFADKGYLSQALLKRLWQRGLHLVTSIRRNMKNYLMPMLDKLLLRKRFIIETLFNKLKSGMGLEHTRHRSPMNALVHILSCLAAYTLAQPKLGIANSYAITSRHA